MTVEEIDIIVEASVEEAVKEFKKLSPTIKKQLSGIQKEFDKVNIKDITANIDMTQVAKKVKQIKKQIKDSFNPNDISGMTIDEKVFKIENIKSYSKEVQKLKGQIGTLNKFKVNTSQVETPKITKIKPQTVNIDTSQVNQNSIWINMLRKYYAMLDVVKVKMHQLRQETEKTGTSQNKWASFFSGFKGKMEQVNSIAQSIRNIFSKMPNITKIITNNIKKMGTGVKSGLGHILKYAGALFSLRGIYSILSNSASSWLSSQNKGAQQLSANIEYMKYAMGSMFAPVIEYIISLVYQLIKAIQSVVYAFSGINIFAKATASSMGKTASSAKKTSKSLAGVHNEINNVSDKENSGGGNSVSPSMDLSQVDSQMSIFTQRLHDFFKPLVDSWTTYGKGLVEQVKITASQIGELIGSVWGSFENIITNGTVYSILKNILAIIGNIAEAFSNAWNYNGNGDAIVQNLANGFNNLLDAINNVVRSDGFQSWLKWCSDKFTEISEKLGSIDWQPLIDALDTIGKNIGTIALEILSGLVDIFKWLVENPSIAEILLAIAVAIGVISTVLSIVSTVMAILNPILATTQITLLPLIGIIAGIIAVIALVVLAIMNWDSILKALSDTWEWIKQKATEIFTALGEFFTNVWQGICDVITNVWNAICDFFKGIWNWIVETVINTFNNIKQFISDALYAISTIWNNIWNGISTFVSNIWNGIISIISNIINSVKDTISNVLNIIKNIWNNIWNGLKDTVTNIFNGIWNAIKSVINWILSGIEKMGNGVVNGINVVIRALNRLNFKMPDWLGGGQFGFNIQTLNTISLPRLAKGNVAYSPLVAQFGEYAGASHNPEITSPKSIMYETMLEALENSNSGNSGDRPIRVQVYWGTKNVVDEIIDGINEKTRQTGKTQIKVSYA